MKLPKLALLALPIAIFTASPAQATFSIVAYDPLTGELGAAGGSCLNN